MGLARCLTVSLVGVDAQTVEIEVDVATGLPQFILSALSDQVLRRLEPRIASAVRNSGESWPNRKVIVAVSPATTPMRGSRFDLPIAATMLAAAEALPAAPLRDLVLLGALTLDGRVLPVTGVLPSVIGAVRAGHTRVVVPRGNLAEARLVPGVEVAGVGSLRELCAWLRGELTTVPGDDVETTALEPEDEVRDLADVVGQERGRRALEVAAAGGHHLLMHGPPGVGKTMLAERLPGLLPDLTEDEALEVTGVHSVAGLLGPGRPMLTRPPYHAPHHSSSLAAIVGGGAGIAGPGAISLAHRGVLFLDEAAEFSRRVLDALRQPLESGEVRLARSGGIATYPARFLLVLAANPCPCSTAGRDAAEHACTCSSVTLRSYQGRLSGPLRDRVDLCVTLGPVSRAVLAEGAEGEPTYVVRARVAAARERTRERLRGTRWSTNGEVPGPVLRRRWPVPARALRSMQHAVDRGALSTRGLDGVLKVSWTLADLAGVEQPGAEHVDEALALRSSGWAARVARAVAV